MSTKVPLKRTMSSPSSVAAATPTTSTTTSAPRPSVRSFTRCTRDSGVGNSFMSITSVAPQFLAMARRGVCLSIAMTLEAPFSAATAQA